MKLPKWNSTAPIEHRKTTAQLRSFAPLRSVRKERFIPTLTSDQVYRAGMQKADAIMNAGNAITKAVVTVMDAKDSGELEAAKAKYLQTISGDEVRLTSQPHETPVLDKAGQPVFNYVTGAPEVKRPWETGVDDFKKQSAESQQAVADTMLTSDKNKKKFAMYAAQIDAQSIKRIQKWQLGHMADRANATHLMAIEQAKSHTMVEELYGKALQKHTDPAKAQAARKKAHQRITFTPLNNHLMQVQTNMMSMSAQDVSDHLGQIYGDWGAVKHTLTAEQNKAVLGGLVSADKDYWNRARPEGQKRALMQDLIDYGMSDPMTQEGIRDKILNSDSFERYGDAGKTFIMDIVKHERYGVDSPEGLALAADIHKDQFFGAADTDEAIKRLHQVTTSTGLSLDTVITSMKEIQREHTSGVTEDNKMAETLFQAATTAVFKTKDWSEMKLSSEIVSDAETDLAVMKQNYRSLVRQAEQAGEVPDRMAIATDVITTMKLPTWARDAEGKYPTSILDVNMEATEMAREKFYRETYGVPDDPEVQSQSELNRNRDLLLLKERQRQVSRILNGLR